jgi:hypothetical protein
MSIFGIEGNLCKWSLVEQPTSIHNERKSIYWYLNSNETSPCNWQIGKLIISMMWPNMSFNLQLMGTTLVFLEKSWTENCFVVGICNDLFVELEAEVLLNMQEANC